MDVQGHGGRGPGGTVEDGDDEVFCFSLFFLAAARCFFIVFFSTPFSLPRLHNLHQNTNSASSTARSTPSTTLVLGDVDEEDNKEKREKEAEALCWFGGPPLAVADAALLSYDDFVSEFMEPGVPVHH